MRRSWPAAAVNALWAAASLRGWYAFRQALHRPSLVQGTLLARYLQQNRDTAFGRARGFSKILAAAGRVRHRGGRRYAEALAAEYQARVPVSTYDDLEPFMERVRRGEPNVLTRQTIQRLVPSSGSTAAVKLVPSTREGLREFTRAIEAWILDLFLAAPALMKGPAYWSISPAIPTETAGTIPVGFDHDTSYVGGMGRLLARAVLAVPDAVRSVTDGETFRYVTLLFLLRARELRLVSVWHPTFFSRLLEGAQEWSERLVRDIHDGTLTPPRAIDATCRARLTAMLPPDRARARQLAALRSLDPSAIWPHLHTVSCWTDGPAAPYREELARRMPAVRIQPKGLIATEGIVTFPFGAHRPVAVQSHFFEFIGPDGRSRLAHDLEQGAEYVVVLTTGAGLYRYRLGDRVRVDGWIAETPSLTFVGKEDCVSDRFGEKLSDGFVAGVFETLFGGSNPRFAMLSPVCRPDGVAYTLFVEGATAPGLEAALESGLRRNPHYAWCVDIGQLKPARVVEVGPDADRAYVDTCLARGRRLGDIKPVSLHVDDGWELILPRVTDTSEAVRTAC